MVTSGSWGLFLDDVVVAALFLGGGLFGSRGQGRGLSLGGRSLGGGFGLRFRGGLLSGGRGFRGLGSDVCRRRRLLGSLGLDVVGAGGAGSLKMVIMDYQEGSPPRGLVLPVAVPVPGAGRTVRRGFQGRHSKDICRLNGPFRITSGCPGCWYCPP